MRIRPVTIDDAPLLLSWRNDPDSRASSRNTHMVDPAEHQDWLAAALERPDALLMIAEDDGGVPVGHVRFVSSADGYEVSIVLAPDQRGKGQGRAVLQAAQEVFFATHPGHPPKAFVRADNLASHRLFRGAGYVLTDSDEVGSWYVGGINA